MPPFAPLDEQGFAYRVAKKLVQSYQTSSQATECRRVNPTKSSEVAAPGQLVSKARPTFTPSSISLPSRLSMHSSVLARLHSGLLFCLLCLCLLVSLSVVVAPALSAGAEAYEEKYPNSSAPAECIDSGQSSLPMTRTRSEPPTSPTTEHEIIANISQVDSNQSRFRINYWLC